MKFPKKIIFIIVMVISIVFSVLFYTEKIAPQRFFIRQETLKSEEIPKSLDDMKILFFSDLYYGSFMDETRFSKLIDTINQSDADVVIFGGDMFDPQVSLTPDTISTVSQYFAKIDAPFGKFAVYGDEDSRNEETLQAVNQVFDQANFEPINNRSIPLHHGGAKSIQLIGLNHPMQGNQDVEAAYENISKNSFVLTVCHTPDSCDQVPSDLTDYFIAGHSLGGQIYYYFDSFYQPAYATNYARGKFSINNTFTLDITNGVGTRGQDMRFLSNAEVVLYQLQHVESVSETPKPEKKKKVETPSSTNE